MKKLPRKVEVGEKEEIPHENLRDWLLSNSSQCTSRSWGPTKLQRNLFHGKTQQTSPLFQPMVRHPQKNTALKWQPEAWAWMNILFTASSSTQLQDKVTLIKTTVLRTYKTSFIWNLMIRYKQCRSAGEISPSKVHAAPRGSPVHWDKELLILVSSAHSWVEQLQDHPKAGGFACALQAGKLKCCAHVCKEYQYWRHTHVQNIHFPLHLLHLKVISPSLEVT